MTDHSRFTQIVSTALEMEFKGRAFYAEQLDRCADELAREVFDRLYRDELVHVSEIERIVARLDAGDAIDPNSFEAPEEEELTLFFRALAAKAGKRGAADAEDLKAVEVGIEFEQNAVSFYQNHLEQTSDPMERRFLQAMVAEERGHFTALVDMKLYLTDPNAWFMEQERGVLDGA